VIGRSSRSRTCNISSQTFRFSEGLVQVTRTGYRLRQCENFHDGVAGGVIETAHDRGVAPRLQRGDNG
jgi:hypothetical protein